jgi:hypothetical protein
VRLGPDSVTVASRLAAALSTRVGANRRRKMHKGMRFTTEGLTTTFLLSPCCTEGVCRCRSPKLPETV